MVSSSGLSRAAYGLLGVLLIVFSWPGSTGSEETEKKIEQVAESAAAKADADSDNSEGDIQIPLSSDKQVLGGIKTAPLLRSVYQTEFQASASVVDIQLLLSLREQFFAAHTDRQSASAALALAEQAIQRSLTLYQSGVTSKRQLQEQQMQLSSLKSRVISSDFRLQSLNEQFITQWGSTLARWAKDSHSSELAQFINGRQALLLLSLPAGRVLPSGIKTIVVDPSGERQTPQTAQFIGAAPQGSLLSQGETYFFSTSRARLRNGMRLSAWIAKSDEKLAGYIIPASAVVWHAGAAGIYVKTAPELFKRILLSDYHSIAHGYFVTHLVPDAFPVVTVGAQTLLSQELRALIPAEEDDSDD